MASNANGVAADGREMITQAEYARRKGVRPARVTLALKAGRIKLHDRLIDPVEADADWEANTDPTSPNGVANRGSNGNGHGKGAGLGRYIDSRGRREELRAKLAEIEYGQKAGDLVPAAEVKRAAFDAARRARNSLLGIPSRLGAVLAGVSDPVEVEKRLREEIERALNSLATREAARGQDGRTT